MSNSNGHPPAALAAFGAALGGFAAGDTAAADAQAALAEALVDSLVQFNAKAVRELAFIEQYLGPDALPLVHSLYRHKRHQIPGATRKLVDAIKALSLSEFMRGVNVNLGGK